jgi:hypothetical protein
VVPVPAVCRRPGGVAGAGCDLRVEQGDALSLGEIVGVAVRPAFDESVAVQTCEVLAHLVGAVAGTQQMAHPGHKAPVGESRGQ